MGSLSQLPAFSLVVGRYLRLCPFLACLFFCCAFVGTAIGYNLLSSASLAPLRFFALVLRLFSCFWVVLWCGPAVPPFPSCDLDSVSIHWFSGCTSVGWCHSWLPISVTLFFLSFWDALAMDMVAILWFWNFSGIFLLSLRFDLSGLGVGMPFQGPELSLDWLRPPFLPFLASLPLV